MNKPRTLVTPGGARGRRARAAGGLGPQLRRSERVAARSAADARRSPCAPAGGRRSAAAALTLVTGGASHQQGPASPTLGATPWTTERPRAEGDVSLAPRDKRGQQADWGPEMNAAPGRLRNQGAARGLRSPVQHSERGREGGRNCHPVLAATPACSRSLPGGAGVVRRSGGGGLGSKWRVCIGCWEGRGSKDSGEVPGGPGVTALLSHAALSATLPRGVCCPGGASRGPRTGRRRDVNSHVWRPARAVPLSQAWAPSRGCRSQPCPGFAALLPGLRLLFCLKPPLFSLVETLAARQRATWTAWGASSI